MCLCGIARDYSGTECAELLSSVVTSAFDVDVVVSPSTTKAVANRVKAIERVVYASHLSPPLFVLVVQLLFRCHRTDELASTY